MPRNASGTYTLPLAPVVADTPIDTTWANPTMDDLAQSMTDSLSRSGNGGMTSVFKLVDTTAGQTATSPALQFVSEANSGIYRSAVRDVRHSINGVDLLRLYEDGSGNRFVQVWDGSVFNDVVSVLPNDVFLQGMNQAGLLPVDIVKINTSDQIEFAAAVVVNMPTNLNVVGNIKNTPLAGTGTRNIGADANGTLVEFIGGASWDPSEGFPNGTKDAPSIFFTANADQGFYSDNVSTWFATNTYQMMRFKSITSDPTSTGVGQFGLIWNGIDWHPLGAGILARGHMQPVSTSLSDAIGIASAVRNGAGDYTMNLNSTVLGANQICALCSIQSNGNAGTIISEIVDTSTVRVRMYQWTGTDFTAQDFAWSFTFSLIE